MPDGDAPSSTRLRGALDLRALLELFALNGFVVVQPVLDVMGRSPDFFLFRRADRSDIVLMTAALTDQIARMAREYPLARA